MSLEQLLIRIQHESNACRKDRRGCDYVGSPDFIDGMIMGLGRARRMVMEQMDQDRAKRKCFKKWAPEQYGRRLQTILNRLNGGDRGRAKKALESILEQIRA